jgi:hypothetical protein
VLSILFSFFSSVVVLGGIGLVSLIIGLKRIIRHLSAKRIMGTFVLLGSILTLACGCKIKIPMTPDIGGIKIPQQQKIRPHAFAHFILYSIECLGNQVSILRGERNTIPPISFFLKQSVRQF